MVSVLIVNYYTEELVYQKDKLCASIPAVEFIVVDNSGTYNRKGNSVKINVGNVGYGRALNIAVERSRYDNLLILNPDVILTIEMLEKILKILESENYTCLTFKLLNEDGTIQRAHSRLQGRLNTVLTSSGIYSMFGVEKKRYLKLTDKMYIEQPLGGCFMIRKEIFKSIGGFGSEYFVFWEDVDFFWRLQKISVKPILRSDITMLHLGSGSFVEGSSWKKRALEVQGRVIYFKNRKWTRPNLVLRILELVAWSIRIRSFRNLPDLLLYFKRLIFWKNVL